MRHYSHFLIFTNFIRSGAPRFEDLTETPGIPLSPEGAEMLYTRYHVATLASAKMRVLELGCAAGQGLGMLDRVAAQLVGGDFSLALLQRALKVCGHRVPLVQLSADSLPFRRASFDLVLCFEASYYVPNMENAFDDIARVLAPGGSVLFVNANPERLDFIRSPHSIHYHSAAEFCSALARRGFSVEVFGAFPSHSGVKSSVARLLEGVLRFARRTLEALRLVPSTLKGRARLKRLIYRKLTLVPAELAPGFANVAEMVKLGSGPQPGYKVIYVRATLAA